MSVFVLHRVPFQSKGNKGLLILFQPAFCIPDFLFKLKKVSVQLQNCFIQKKCIILHCSCHELHFWYMLPRMHCTLRTWQSGLQHHRLSPSSSSDSRSCTPFPLCTQLQLHSIISSVANVFPCLAVCYLLFALFCHIFMPMFLVISGKLCFVFLCSTH